MKRKPKALLIFADIDKTIAPYNYKKDIEEFLTLIREIQEKENVTVKFCPISGRPGAYVRRFLHEWRDHAKYAGLDSIFELGAGEQGAVIVDARKSYENIYLGNPNTLSLKRDVDSILKNHRFGKWISDEWEKIYTCSLHIRDEVAKKLTRDEQKKIYGTLSQDILSALGAEKIYTPMAHNCLEVIPNGIGKAESINYIQSHYRKTYEIVGITFSGDAENDKTAVNYISKLAEIPGVKSNVFLPGNADKSIESDSLEGWKEKNTKASGNRIQKSEIPLFAGVLKLMRKAYEEKTLLGKGLQTLETRDDLALIRRRELGRSM